MEKIEYNAMLSRIQKEIINNKEEIEKIAKIDNEYCKIRVEINKFIEIIEYYKQIELEKINKKITVICNGNPYIVLNIAMIAITKNIKIEVNIDDTMLGVNKLILKILDKILKENKLTVEVKLTQTLEGENLIFIDRINDFNLGKQENAKYIQYESIDIYSDDEKFEELYERIYNYAIDMNIDVDTFDDEDIETMIKYGKGKRKIILTSNKEVIEKYKKENIYINENPFKNEIIIFDKEMVERIIR